MLAEEITDGYFDALAVRPAIGRTFAPEDYADGRHVAIISDALWRQRFGGDPLAVGQMLEIDGIATEIAGVLPPDFRSPNDERLGDEIRFLRPFVMRPDLVDNRDDHELEVVGRLKARRQRRHSPAGNDRHCGRDRSAIPQRPHDRSRSGTARRRSGARRANAARSRSAAAPRS